jgi:hypothetical protein
MSQLRKRILIVEDTEHHLKLICREIHARLGSSVVVLPPNIRDTTLDLDDFNVLIETLQKRDFERVSKHYQEIDLFIIDATLAGGRDRIGIDFYRYLKQKLGAEKTKAIIISNTDDTKRFVDGHAPFISKLAYGIDENFPKVLVDTVVEILKLDSLSTSGAGTAVYSHDQAKKHGWLFSLNTFYLSLFRRIERYVIDPLVLLTFHLLLITTVGVGGYNIIYEVVLADYGDDHDLLRKAEHIFLNMLPVFIVFGFFNYYKSNIRVALLDGNMHNVSDEMSTKAMNLSKHLFISSIISYVLIKIIEQIAAPVDDFSIIRLVSFGIFLLITIAFFVFLEHKKIVPKEVVAIQDLSSATADDKPLLTESIGMPIQPSRVPVDRKKVPAHR